MMTPPKKTIHSRLYPWLVRIILLLLALFVGYQLWIVLHIAWWQRHPPTQTAFMEQRLEVLRQSNNQAQLQYQWLPYAKISRELKRAVIASEDGKFVHHTGFDWQGMETALEKNLHKGRIVAGGSTISQQLAKNLFLSSERTPWRKLQEAIITVMLETILDKRRILEIYLNVIEWGNGIFGAEAAARHYYGMSAQNLTASQAAKLASMIPNPRYYDLHRNSSALQRKTGIILRRQVTSEIP